MEMTGFIVTIVGMGVVFLILGLLAVLAWGLERLFRTQPEKKAEKEKEGTPETEIVIMAALAYHVRRKGPIHLERVEESVWMQKARVYE